MIIREQQQHWSRQNQSIKSKANALFLNIQHLAQ